MYRNKEQWIEQMDEAEALAEHLALTCDEYHDKFRKIIDRMGQGMYPDAGYMLEDIHRVLGELQIELTNI